MDKENEKLKYLETDLKEFEKRILLITGSYTTAIEPYVAIKEEINWLKSRIKMLFELNM